MKEIISVETLEQAPVLIDTAESTEHFRARVFRMPTGTTVTIPIKEGSRGPLYTNCLTSTKHGKLRTTTRHYHLSFDIPITEGLAYAAQCVDDEICHFIDYMKHNN